MDEYRTYEKKQESAMTEATIQNMIVQIHRAKSAKQREVLIGDAEAQGFTVERKRDRYVLSKDGEHHSLPDKLCEQCHQSFLLIYFLGKQGAEQPWCEQCRKTNPQGVRKAFDHMRFHKQYQAMSPEQRRTFRQNVEKRESPRLSKQQLQRQAYLLCSQVLEGATETLLASCAEMGYSHRQTRAVLKEREQLLQYIQKLASGGFL